MQASDSLIPIGLGSGRPLPSAYPGARATRSNEGLPGVRAVLFQRAVVVDPAGCGALLAHGAGPAVAFRLHEALGTQEDVVPRLQGLRPTRSRTYASATALPRSPQGSLPAWVGWPLTGRGSHPLDDTQGFMTYSSIPLDRPAWPHHATTPQVVAAYRTQRRSWEVMTEKVGALLDEYPGPAAHDATGVGSAIGDFPALTPHDQLQGVTLVGRVRTDLFRNYIEAIERHEIVCPRIDVFYTEHLYCGEDDLFGSGHPPDTVVAMALAYHAFKAGRQPGDYGVTI